MTATDRAAEAYTALLAAGKAWDYARWELSAERRRPNRKLALARGRDAGDLGERLARSAWRVARRNRMAAEQAYREAV